MFTKLQTVTKRIMRVTKFGQLIADTAEFFHNRGVELGVFDADEVKE